MSSVPLTELGDPEIIEIEPTLTCNLRCIMCHVSYQKLEKTMLDVSVLPRLKRAVKGRWVLLGSSYEPAAHPRFAELAVGLSESGAKLDLTTNGTIISKKTADAISACNFHNVTISFDGATKASYEAIRRNARFEQALERILYFKSSLRKKDAFFAVNNTLMRRNLDEAAASVDLWESHGFDHLGLILMVIRDYNETLKHESLEHEKDKVYRVIEEAARGVIEKDYRLTLSSAALNRSGGIRERYPANFVDGCVRSNNPRARLPYNPRTYYQKGHFPGMPVDCRSPFKYVRILHNGNVELCYRFVVGNIYKEDLLDIWYGEKAQRVRKLLLGGPEVCLGCDFYRFCIKAGEVDYEDSQNFRQGSHTGDLYRKYQYQTLIETRGCYKIVAWLDKFYALPAGVGSVSFGVDDLAPLESAGVVLSDASLESLRARLPSATPSSPLLQGLGAERLDRLYGTVRTLGLAQSARLALFRWKRR